MDSQIFQKIRIKREISGRMICMNIGTLFVLRPVSQNIPFYAHAIIIFIRIVDKINIDPISTHIIRREILNWIRIWDQNLISAYGSYLGKSVEVLFPGSDDTLSVTQFQAIDSRIFLFDRACLCLFGVNFTIFCEIHLFRFFGV